MRYLTDDLMCHYGSAVDYAVGFRHPFCDHGGLARIFCRARPIRPADQLTKSEEGKRGLTPVDGEELIRLKGE
jgi:hypothetical protein